MKSQLRVGFIIYGGLDSCSGGYLYDRKILEGLRKLGADVEVLSLPLRNYGLHLTDNFSAALFRILNRQKWDILIQDELCHPSLIRLNACLHKTAPYPILSIVHHLRCCEKHPGYLQNVYRHVEKRYLQTVDGLILNSRTTECAVQECLKRSLPAVVAYPGRDHLSPQTTKDKIAVRCKITGPLRLLFLGNVIRRKGLHVLLQALEQLPYTGWQLTIAGDHSPQPRYTKRIFSETRKQGWHHSIRFAGYVAHAEMASLLESHHVLVMPSQYEGFGIAALDAMGFGMPVIASTTGAMPEWITNGVEGFLMLPDAPSHWASRIKDLMDNRTRLLEMSTAAIQKYAQHPTWDEAAGRVFDFIQDMIAYSAISDKK
jgi:glycosyltransferase involved in cell wall biosynthesis